MDEVLDIQNICRICLEHSDILKSIFQEEEKCTNKSSVCDEVMFCTQIKIEQDEALPSQICDTCLQNLDRACCFKRLCESSHTRLEFYMQKIDRLDGNSETSEPQINLIKSDPRELVHISIKEEYVIDDHTENELVEDDSNSEILPENDYELDKDAMDAKALVIRNIELIQRSLQKRKGQMCEICGKIFQSKYDLETHNTTHTGVRPFKCDCCPKTFAKEAQLKCHLKDHAVRERKHLCSFCGNGFLTSMSLANHIRIHTNERPYKCQVCDKTFRQSGGLSTHLRTHTGDKPFKCEKCSKQCTTRSDLTVHMRTHTRETPYKCEFCIKSFSTASNLLKHRRQHLNERQFKCDICGVGFNVNEGLKNHRRIHTGERPFSCTMCDKSFRTHSKLSSHKKIHTGVQPYSCKICFKKFRYSYSMNVHMRTQHDICDTTNVPK